MTYSTCRRLHALNGTSVIWAHCLSLWSVRLSKFPTSLTSHRYGLCIIQIIFKLHIARWSLVWLGNLTPPGCAKLQPPSNQRGLHEFEPYGQIQRCTNDKKKYKAIQVTRVSWHLLQNSGYKTSCLLSKLHLPMTRTDSSRCRAANHENRTHISFQLGDHRLPTSFADKNQ